MRIYAAIAGLLLSATVSSAQTPYRKVVDSVTRLSLSPLRIDILVDAAKLGGPELEVAEITFPADSGGAPHRHGAVELLYVLQGELDHTVNGETRRLSPGMIGIVRVGDVVSHRVASQGPARVLVIWGPGGEGARLAQRAPTSSVLPIVPLDGMPEAQRVLPRNTDPSLKDLSRSIEVAAPLDSVWWAWTTEEGLTSFFAPRARIDLRIGGRYELYFRADQPPGWQGSEGARILSFEPRRMLSFDWRAPPELPDVRRERTWMVIRLDSLGPRLTRVTMTQLGWQRGDEWRKNYEFFEKAMDEPMNNLKKRFEAKRP